MIFIAQHDKMDCGPACLAMIASWHGKTYALKFLRESAFISREGVSLLGISEAARKIGFKATSVKISIHTLTSIKSPAIIHWNQNHFVVLVAIKKSRISGKLTYQLADPGHGLIQLSEEAFKKSWLSDGDDGIALLLEPTATFFQQTPQKENKLSLTFLFSFVKPYKKQVTAMFILLLAGSLITFVLPFMTRNLIDKGVNAKNLNIITLILVAQLALYIGTLTISIIRNWLMLYVGAKINITIISDYLKKLLKLPIKFFDAKMMGDFNQRIQDHERIETFLTSQSLITFFSLLTFTAFLGVLWYYNSVLLLIYAALTLFSVIWSYGFLAKRRVLDYYRFQQRSENQESIYEIINGVTEIKLNQLEEYKRERWENIQDKLFKINMRVLRLDQFQLTGFDFINQVKNILVTFFSATFVVTGKMTLGELLSVSFIIGQMNSPVNQLVNFFRSLQDAKLALERLNEVTIHEEEELTGQLPVLSEKDLTANGAPKGITISNLSFQYGASQSPYVLRYIDLFIPEGKVTAIVGSSGSGKTTLMKLLLKFYTPAEGTIQFNHTDLSDISSSDLRKNCGVVMQDGFIFSDTIERNIITSAEKIDIEKYHKAINAANINEFIDALPLKEKTKIGAAGNGISGGQKQRILIARSIYKNPHYIFFDEATSALDAENEKKIHDQLTAFFKGKTVLIIAHRLSTVKNADQIIVLKNGIIVERGHHKELVSNQSEYFNLVKNQLELGG